MKKIESEIIEYIIDYYKKNKFYPNYDEIAKGVERTKSTIYTHMGSLESKGIIVRKSKYSPMYRLLNIEFILTEGSRI